MYAGRVQCPQHVSPVRLVAHRMNLACTGPDWTPGASDHHLARRRGFPQISLSCPRYRDPDGLYDSLKEKASSLFEETSPLAPPSLESPPLPQPATSETLLLMEDVEESGIPPAESHMDLPSSRPTQELEREMDLIAVRESVAAGDGSRLVGSRHSGNCVRTYVRCCKPLGLCMYRHTYVHTCVYPTPCSQACLVCVPHSLLTGLSYVCVYPTPCSQACLMCVCTPLPAHRPVLCVCVPHSLLTGLSCVCVCVPPHSLLTGLSCVCVYPTPCSQACLMCVCTTPLPAHRPVLCVCVPPHSLLTGLSCVCTTPLPAHRPVLCVCVPPHSLLTGLSYVCVYHPTPCSQACLVCVPHSLLTGLSYVCVYHPTPCSQACLVCVPHSLLTGLSCVCVYPTPCSQACLVCVLSHSLLTGLSYQTTTWTLAMWCTDMCCARLCS